MERTLVTTDDGSHTFYLPEIAEHFHSTHGAIQESKHVFIEAGLKQAHKKDLNIFEVGFGTGLNALLSYIEAINKVLNINYIGIEKFPLKIDEYESLNYAHELGTGIAAIFEIMHQSAWNKTIEIDPNFKLTKIDSDLISFQFFDLPRFDLIFFDAFAPDKQPEMWTPQIFQQLYHQCKPGGILVTYCAKGEIRRILQSSGFRVERLKGPPGKREMLRGIK